MGSQDNDISGPLSSFHGVVLLPPNVQRVYAAVDFADCICNKRIFNSSVKSAHIKFKKEEIYNRVSGRDIVDRPITANVLFCPSLLHGRSVDNDSSRNVLVVMHAAPQFRSTFWGFEHFNETDQCSLGCYDFRHKRFGLCCDSSTSKIEWAF